MSTNVSPALRKLITDTATGPVDWAHPQFFTFPAGGRDVTIFHTDGKFDHGYTGRNGDFIAQHSSIKAIRQAVQ